MSCNLGVLPVGASVGLGGSVEFTAGESVNWELREVGAGELTPPPAGNGLLNGLTKSWEVVGGVWREQAGAGPNGVLSGAPSVVDVAVANGKAFGVTASLGQFIKMAYDANMSMDGNWQWALAFSIPSYQNSLDFDNYPFINNVTVGGMYTYVKANSPFSFGDVLFLTDGSSVDGGAEFDVISLDTIHLVSLWWEADEKVLYGKVDGQSLYTSLVQAFGVQNSTDDWWIASGGDNTGWADGKFVSLNWWKAVDGDDLPGEAGHDSLWASGAILQYSDFTT